MVKDGAGRREKALVQQTAARANFPYQEQHRWGYGVNQQSFAIAVYKVHDRFTQSLLIAFLLLEVR